MTHKSTTHRRLFTCILVVALLVATFIASTFTTSANTTVLEGVELKLGHTIGFVYYSKQEYTENTVMRFEINGRITDVSAIPNDKTCAFIFNDIYPHELAHEIKTTVFVDGEPVVTYPAFSMREYLLNELLKIKDLDKSDNKKHARLISNLLQYGESTREYRNDNVDASERDDVTILNIDKSIYTAYIPDDLNEKHDGEANDLGVSANGIHLSSIGIAYRNTNNYVVTLVIPDNVNVPMEAIKVKFGDDKDAIEYSMDDTQNPNIKNVSPGVYEIYSDPIHANEITTYSPQITLSISGNEVQRINYSCKDYVLHLQQIEPNTRAENYAQALYYYGEAAKDVYENPTVIALGPLEKPKDITLTNSQPHKPTGGLGAAYMSDGSIQEVELEWGFVEAITDDTYKVEREVVGQYKDPITGRVYSAKSTVTLLNPLKEIQRWTDPSNITPDINTTEYVIKDAEVKAIWSNGFEDIRPANEYTIKESYAECLVSAAPLTLQYTDPNSKVTKSLSEEVFVYFDNPVISIEMSQISPLLFSEKTQGQIIADPQAFTYTITLASGYSNTYTFDEWFANYDVDHTYPSYNGTETTKIIKIDWEATRQTPIEITQQYKDGEIMPDYYLQANQPISWSCEAEFYNPITEIELMGDPSCTLTSTELPSSENKMLSGGIVTAYHANGASEILANSLVQYAAEATIIDTTYSKKVAYVATYQGLQDSGIITITNPIKENSLVQDPNGKMHVYASSWDQTYTTAYLEHFSEGLKVTYANGVTANVSPLNFCVGEHAGETEFYTHNIQDSSRISQLYTDGGWTSPNLTTGKGIVKGLYTDDRAGVTGARTMTCELHYYVINEPQSTTTNYPQALAENYQNQYLTDRRATIEVVLMNGIKSVANVYLEQIENIQNDDEYALKQCDVYYSTPYYTMTSGSYGVYVYNPADKINFVKADPSPIQVTDTNAITSSAIEQSPGLLEVTLHNGKTKSVKPQSFTGLENVKITDKTIAKQFDIIAHYQTQEYEDATKLTTEGLTRPVKLILRNPPTEAIITLTKGTQSNPIVLTNTSQKINFTSKIKYSNKITEDVTPTSAQYLYPTGKLSSGTATDQESGNAEMTVTLLCTQSVTFERLNINGAQINDTIPSEDEKTVSKKVNVYWKNNPVSITKNSLSCAVKNYNTEKVTPSAKVNVTYTNGVTKNNVTAVATPVNNIKDNTYQVTQYTNLSYTANGVTVCLNGQSVKLSNYATNYAVSNITTSFENSINKSVSIMGNVTLKNGLILKNVAATSLSIPSSSFSPGTYTKSGNTVAVSYTKPSIKNLTATGCTATYSGYGSKTSNKFNITVQNNIKTCIAYKDASYSKAFPNYSAASDESDYPVYSFTSGNTTTFTGSALYLSITYNNGANERVYWDAKPNNQTSSTRVKWVNAPIHDVAYIYKSIDGGTKRFTQHKTPVTATYSIDGASTQTIYTVNKTDYRRNSNGSYAARDGYTRPVNAYIDASEFLIDNDCTLEKQMVTITYDHYTEIKYANGKSTKSYQLGIKENANAIGYIGNYKEIAQPLTSRNDAGTENRAKSYMLAASYRKWTDTLAQKPMGFSIYNAQHDSVDYSRELFIKAPITCLKFKDEFKTLYGTTDENKHTQWFAFNFYRSMYYSSETNKGTYELIYRISDKSTTDGSKWTTDWVKTW